MAGAPHPDAMRPVVTDRLVLTPISDRDVDELELLHGDPLVSYWTGPWTPDSIDAWARAAAAGWAQDGVGKWMAHGRLDGALVGRGGLSRIDLDGEAVLEVGWAVRDGLTGGGFASEIGRAAVRWARSFFPTLPVVAFTEVHNTASRAVMRRIGLHDSAVIHRPGRIAGSDELHDAAPFALHRDGPSTEPSRR